jgi:hypothetical protein
MYQNGENIPNNHKIYQSALKYTKWPENGSNGHKTYQHHPLLGPPKFTQIRIFGLKIYHLATLGWMKGGEDRDLSSPGEENTATQKQTRFLDRFECDVINIFIFTRWWDSNL